MKKKIFIVCLLTLSLFITGCSEEKKENNTKKEEEKVLKKDTKKEEKEKEKYLNYVKKLKKVTESSEDLPFTIEVLYDKIENEVRYQVIIDNPKEEIKNITALAIHNMQTDDVFPSVGIFDDKVNLVPGEKPSGVILVGYIPYEGKLKDLEIEMKVLVSYKINDEEHTSYYLTKK